MIRRTSKYATMAVMMAFAAAGKGIVMHHPGTWYAYPDWPELNAQIVGGGARGQSARFQHEDALPGQPGFVEQRQRHAGGLAGAGRRFQHRLVAAGQCGAQRGQYGVDGQGLHGCFPGQREGAPV